MASRYTGSIRTKVILITIVCTTAVLAAVGIFDSFKVISSEKNKLESLAQVTANRLSQHLVIPMWDLDKERIADALEAEMLEQNLQGIVVYDEDGNTVMSAKERDHNWNVVGSSGKISGAYFTASTNVSTDDKSIGRVDVFVSDRFIQSTVQSAILLEVGRVLLLNIAIMLVLLLLLGKFLVSPIKLLAEQASEISSGKLNTSIEVSSNDELGLLADSITRMQKSLIVAFKKLRQANKVGGA